ncbi:MAG: ABC transporter permease [Propylenella sp.]
MRRLQLSAVFQRIEALPIMLVFLVLLLLFMYLSPEAFLRPFQYTTFLSTLPPVILLAIGLTFIIGAGEIDLCFPAIIGFSGFVFAVVFKDGHEWFVTALGVEATSWLASNIAADITQWFAVVAALAAGVLVGFVNGVLVAKIGIPSFIATLGAQFFWYGMATVLSGGRSYALRGAEESSVWEVLVGRPFAASETDWMRQVPIQALWTAIIVVILWFILNRHRFGEHTLFIGDSNEVSRVVGINVDREKIKLFTLMGLLAAIAAIFLTLENKNYFGNQGQGFLLISIASVLIGGTSIFGGRATIVGTVFGCFIIIMVEPGLVATGLTGAWVNTVRGLIFLIAIILYLFVEEPQRRSDFFARVRGMQAFGRIGSADGRTVTSPTRGEAARVSTREE